MNIHAYTEALTQAEAEAVRYKDSRVVVYWPALDRFSQYFMSVHIRSESFDSSAKIAAYVDHMGIISESLWIKEQLGLAEVAA